MYKIKVKNMLNIESRDDIYTIYTKKENGGYNWKEYKKNKIPKKFYEKQGYVSKVLGYVDIRIVD